MSRTRQVLFCGHAKLPADIANCVVAAGEHLVLTLLIDVEAGNILAVDCNLVSSVVRNHVVRLLTGVSLLVGPDRAIKIIDAAILDGTKKPLIAALKLAYDSFKIYTEPIDSVSKRIAETDKQGDQLVRNIGTKMTAWIPAIHILGAELSLLL